MGLVREGTAERGFTLIELMIVVGIVAILAAVVIPSFMSSGTKSKARAETAAMFSEIATKQEQYKAEKNFYMGLITGTNYVGSTTCPGSVPTANYNFTTTCVTSGTAWEQLRIVPSESSLRCQYTITTGAAGSALTPPTGFVNSQGAAGAETPATSWWTTYAKCNNTGDSGFAEYFQTSIDRKIQRRNEGH